MLPNLYILEHLQRQQERELRAALLARALYDIKKERHNRLAHQVTRCCRLISKLVTKLWQNGQRTVTSSLMTPYHER